MNFSLAEAALAAVVAFAASIVGGLSGYGVGLVLPVVIAPIVGVTGVIPAMAIAISLGNGSRVTAPDTVPFALWCAARHADDFEEAMWTTVAGLGDRDTTCAIAGGIVAAGGASIPAQWLEAREPLPKIAT